ncbi:hypothetical protein TRICI_001547 [Trichomonascus ciferrii]|uniref:Uncharacterized protein n=1 Tax=Trichomonascus ciferrii TaxID=44093 RepID=A0A642VCC3_9ASCO|nr:hypothetical protein TRICI_001547 [Trichomonascus ciferrii]
MLLATKNLTNFSRVGLIRLIAPTNVRFNSNRPSPPPSPHKTTISKIGDNFSVAFPPPGRACSVQNKRNVSCNGDIVLSCLYDSTEAEGPLYQYEPSTPEKYDDVDWV